MVESQAVEVVAAALRPARVWRLRPAGSAATASRTSAFSAPVRLSTRAAEQSGRNLSTARSSAAPHPRAARATRPVSSPSTAACPRTRPAAAASVSLARAPAPATRNAERPRFARLASAPARAKQTARPAADPTIPAAPAPCAPTSVAYLVTAAGRWCALRRSTVRTESAPVAGAEATSTAEMGSAWPMSARRAGASAVVPCLD